MTIRDSILMGYLDGQLTKEETAEVAAQIAVSPTLKATVEKLQQDNTLLSQTFRAMDEKPVRDDTMELLDSFTRREDFADTASTNVIALDKKPQVRPSFWIPAIAASVALFVGLGAGMQLPNLQSGSDDQVPAVYAQQSAGRITATNVLFNVLENNPSSRSSTLDPGGDTVAMPLTSFRATNGAFCREYEVSSSLSASHNIACRGKEAWIVEMTAKRAVARPNDDNRPAGNYNVASQDGAPTIDSAIRSMMAGDALSLDEEGKMIKKKWQ